MPKDNANTDNLKYDIYKESLRRDLMEYRKRRDAQIRQWYQEITLDEYNPDD